MGCSYVLVGLDAQADFEPELREKSYLVITLLDNRLTRLLKVKPYISFRPVD
jgi:hypothetical protein